MLVSACKNSNQLKFEEQLKKCLQYVENKIIDKEKII